MATEIQAPNHEGPDDGTVPIRVFLAGSIEMGKAEPWQARVVAELEGWDNVILFNPRRDDWDSSWTQEMTNPQFFEQVTWEMDRQRESDIIVFYFDPATQSPITLLELGHALGKDDQNIIVCCPPGYFRKGNVDIACSRSEARIPVVETFEEFMYQIRNFLLTT